MAELNFKNRTLYHGDNLEFLRGMNSETVHLIATDPPFNKNRDHHATPDSLAAGARFKDRWRWDEDVHEEWTDSIQDDWPAAHGVIAGARLAYGDNMAAFLCWMGVRLMEMHRVLRPDGSLYLHTDDTAFAYLKVLLDAIFGADNLRGQIVWQRYGSHNDAKKFGRVCDLILFYAKDGKGVWNGAWTPLDKDYVRRTYRKQDQRGRYRTAPLHTGGLSGGGYTYEFRGHTRTWRYPLERMRELEADNRIAQARDGKGVPERKVYLNESKGRPASNVWTDIKALTGNHKERTGYPTQKPLALYERMIRASSNEGDIVLDPFCGCATTPIAAERLKRQWVGMDIWDGAYTQVMERMERDTVLRVDDKNHVSLPQVYYETEPPRRTDKNELAAPSLKLRTPRGVEPWEKLTHRQMVKVLVYAQRSNGNVICAGCGRELEREFMELDHIQPRADGGENHIRNRILLCRPCNGRKGQYLTLRGLIRENKQAGWLKDEGLAQMAREAARERADWVRDDFDSEECQALIDGS
ncbi:MAG: DNA methyltransferase [Chloroflexi bacterium]|nr:DNA methyltransferase [Chloroflexota bacterium]MCY4246766.1 DNA methyltransferase [Chloroflexota bacterium]